MKTKEKILEAARQLEEVAHLMVCPCGQRSWIPGYIFNRPGCLKYGTPYRCPTCDQPLGDDNFAASDGAARGGGK
jgi:hypothetical protein